MRVSPHAEDHNVDDRAAVHDPLFNGPNQFAVDFTFDVMPKATGQRITLE
jgi:hypothetical protein